MRHTMSDTGAAMSLAYVRVYTGHRIGRPEREGRDGAVPSHRFERTTRGHAHSTLHTHVTQTDRQSTDGRAASGQRHLSSSSCCHSLSASSSRSSTLPRWRRRSGGSSGGDGGGGQTTYRASPAPTAGGRAVRAGGGRGEVTYRAPPAGEGGGGEETGEGWRGFRCRRRRGLGRTE